VFIGKSGAFDGVFFGHQDRQGAGKVQVLGLIVVVVGEGVRDDGDVLRAQHGEKAFGVADPGNGVDAQALELRQGDGAASGERLRVGAVQVHGPVGEVWG